MRKQKSAPDVPARVVQQMPGGRVRIDPAHQPDLAAWIITLAERYERTSRLSLSGLSGRARDIRKGQIAWAKCMLMALSAIADSLTETVQIEAYNRAVDTMTRALGGVLSEGDECHSM